MTGRCWPGDGAGGTLNADGDGPGPYYRQAAAGIPQVGGGLASTDPLERAVFYGVTAIQHALNRLLPGTIKADGIFGASTTKATVAYQAQAGLSVDGVVGPQTAKALLLPLTHRLGTTDVPSCLLEGQITNESMWDPGAIGFVDDRDRGLLQINGRWHPDVTESEAFAPTFAIKYCIGMYQANLAALDGRTEDAVAAYNLGLGGARTWINHNRPSVIDYLPTGPVYIQAYISRITSNCH